MRVCQSGSDSGSGSPGGIAIWWSGPASGAWKLACRLKIARPCWMATTRRVREAAAVAEPVDLVEDRHRRVAGAQEVGVQRVDEAGRVVDGAGRGDERLAGDLAAEDALAVLVGRAAAEDVDLDRLEREEGHEFVEGGLHARHHGAAGVGAAPGTT